MGFPEKLVNGQAALKDDKYYYYGAARPLSNRGPPSKMKDTITSSGQIGCGQIGCGQIGCGQIGC